MRYTDRNTKLGQLVAALLDDNTMSEIVALASGEMKADKGDCNTWSCNPAFFQEAAKLAIEELNDR